MRFCKIFHRFLLLLFCINVVQTVYAQGPVIVPKPGPIVLQLGASGKYKAVLADVAAISGVTDISKQVMLNPSSFDCSTLGQQTIAVTAIDGSFGVATDANTATFNHPFGITSDLAGNFYITDQLGNTIRKITPQGQVLTIAGNGRPVSIDGIGTSASFEAPSGIVADASGNLYVTDNVSGMIRKIAQDGTVTTIAGNHTNFTDIDGIGTAASFTAPVGIAIDAKGNLYVADQGSSRIRKITTTLQVITIAGSSPGYADGNGAGAHFNGPSGITVDAAGNLFVCDDYNRRIRKITPKGDVSTVAGSATPGSFNGTGTSAGFAGVVGVVADNNNNLYVTESGVVSKIRKISPQGVVTTLAGTGVPGFLDDFGVKARVNYPAGLIIDPKGNLYVADDANNRIRKVSPQGVVSTFAGTGNAVDKDGNIDPPSIGNIAEVQIPVTIESNATVVNNLKSSYTVISGSCVAVMPDYTSFVKATDNCTGAVIPFTQSPLPGTSLSVGVPANVAVSTNSALLNMLSFGFTVTATGPQTNPVTVTILASADSVCKGTPVTFNAKVVNGSTTLTYQWLVNGINAGLNSPAFTTSVLNDKDVVNCAVISGAGCVVPVLGNGFTIKVNPVPVIKFNQNPVITGGSGIRLAPAITGGNIAAYLWSPATGLDDATQENPFASPANTTTYQLRIISTGGCDTVATVTVTVLKPIVIPNAFTPNGDSINDLWDISYLNDYTGCTVDVFNRYGQLMFHSNGYGKAWNGTKNGSPLPSGVYYYVIDLKNGTKKLSGQVTIIK